MPLLHLALFPPPLLPSSHAARPLPLPSSPSSLPLLPLLPLLQPLHLQALPTSPVTSPCHTPLCSLLSAPLSVCFFPLSLPSCPLHLLLSCCLCLLSPSLLSPYP